MSGKQHQLLAILPSLQGSAKQVESETVKTFRERHGHFLGLFKTYTPHDEEGDKQPNDGNPHVVTTVGEKVDYFAKVWGQHINAMLQVEATNQEATGDIAIGDTVIGDVPATFLIQLDKKLNVLRAVLGSMPTLDPQRAWKDAPDKGEGISTCEPITSYSYKKVRKNHELAPATEHHPAQVEMFIDDVQVGQWLTQHWSGMIAPAVKAGILSRLDTLQQAVKKALSQANDTQHSTRTIARDLFSFVLGDLPLSRS